MEKTAFDLSKPCSSMEPKLGRQAVYLDRDLFLTQTVELTTVYGLRLYNFLCAGASIQKEDFIIYPERFGKQKRDFYAGLKELERKGFLKKVDKKKYVFIADPTSSLTFQVQNEDAEGALNEEEIGGEGEDLGKGEGGE